jgi:hypothetical protein
MSKKTALFFNGDYHLQKPLTVKELYAMPFGEVYEIFHGKHDFLRANTGNFVFTNSLVKITDSEWVGGRDFDKLQELKPKSLITNLLNVVDPTFYYTQQLDYWNHLLDILPDTKIVTLSLGFSDYYIDNPVDTLFLKILKRFEERAVLGVRGDYSASILERNGIKNVQIIGCPSMYYHMDRDFKLDNPRKEKVENLNFTADFFASMEKSKLKKVVKYGFDLYNKHEININTTLQHHFITDMVLSNDSVFHSAILTKLKNVMLEFKYETGRYFFDIDSWIDALKKDDFTMGTMLHGNIASVLAKTPAIFFYRDQRMRELSDFYKFPNIKLKEFDKSKPLEYYYELADYSEFNKNFSNCFDRFVAYCKTNDVDLKFN